MVRKDDEATPLDEVEEQQILEDATDLLGRIYGDDWWKKVGGRL